MLIQDAPTATTALLRDRFDGSVVIPGDNGYDAARGGFNLTNDLRPAAVATPAIGRGDRRPRWRRPRRRPADRTRRVRVTTRCRSATSRTPC